MATFEDTIRNSTIRIGMAANDAAQAIADLIDAAADQGRLPPGRKPDALRAVLNRELSASTAMPGGIALPHGRTDAIDDPVCVIGIYPNGVPFGAENGEPSHIIVMLLVPTATGTNHIHFLANLSRRLLEQSVRNELLAARTRDDAVQTLLSHSDRRPDR